MIPPRVLFRADFKICKHPIRVKAHPKPDPASFFFTDSINYEYRFSLLINKYTHLRSGKLQT